MESAIERHGIKLYFLTKQKDRKSVSGDFNVSVVYDFFFRTVFLFRAQHIFVSRFRNTL